MKIVKDMLACLGLLVAAGAAALAFVLSYDSYKRFLPGWILPAFAFEVQDGEKRQRQHSDVSMLVYRGPLVLWSKKFDFTLFKEGWDREQVFTDGARARLEGGRYTITLRKSPTNRKPVESWEEIGTLTAVVISV